MIDSLSISTTPPPSPPSFGTPKSFEKSPSSPHSSSNSHSFNMSMSPLSMKSKNPTSPRGDTHHQACYSIMEPANFHLHFIPFENYNAKSPGKSKNPSNNGNGVLTIAEILTKIPSPLPKEYQTEIQNRTKSIANLFDHIKQSSSQMANKLMITHGLDSTLNLQQQAQFQNQQHQLIQNKMMDYMNRKFREWLVQSGYDKEYKVFLPPSGSSQRNAARKRSNSGSNK